ncbi:MAG: metallophosphoesterase [Candidatus Micrarchaeia archaeon]|jgi:hypothetical protein
MKLLALSDLHADEELLDRLRMLSASKKYDAALFCGDLTTNGPVSYAEEALSLFMRSFAVFGNMDPPEVAGRIQQMGKSVHGRSVKLDEWKLAGVGGSNPTPFGTPSEFSEGQIAAFLSAAGVDRNTILMSHPPPYGVFDLAGDVHVGSKSVRECIEKNHPLMVLCGHIHEHVGQEVLGETLVVKLPPAEKLLAAEITIGKEIEVEFIAL